MQQSERVNEASSYLDLNKELKTNAENRIKMMMNPVMDWLKSFRSFFHM